MKHSPCLPAMLCTALRAALCAVFLFSAAAARGQTAADLESLLDTEAVTCAQAAWLVLAAVQDEPPHNPEAAFNTALANTWLPAKSESGGAITLGGLSLLMVKALNIKGGLMYRIFPLGRYAYREMISRGFIEGRAYSTSTVSGEQLLRIVETVLAKRETE